MTIKNCESVSTEGQAFSWLLNMNITNVHTLQLGPGSFTLDPSAGNVGEHGPGMSVSIVYFYAYKCTAKTGTAEANCSSY